MNKLFSIIVPVYNRGKLLEQTLQSIYNSLYRPLELILVDNGSTDDSLECCWRFKEKHEEPDFCIKVLSEKKPGASAARNKGAAEANGSYLYFFDSDDEMSDDYLSDMSAIIADAEFWDLIVVRTRLILNDGKVMVRKSTFRSSVTDQILTGMLSTQSLFIKKDFFFQVGGWNEHIFRWNDWELGIRCLMSTPRVYWEKKIYHRIYSHPDSITGVSFLKDKDIFSIVIKHVRKMILSYPYHSVAPLRALNVRAVWLAANYSLENKDDGKNMLYKVLEKEPSKRYKMLYRVFYMYVRKGGRGVWRIARWFI